MASAEEINVQASVLMKQGIRLMGDGAPADALPLFEQALALRQQLPPSNPTFAFGLAACWLNRGDALKLRGDAASIAEAIHSYDEGIKVLQILPLDTDARFPRRLAIGHQNRGLLHLSQGRVDAAIADLHTAIAVLDRAEAAAIDDRRYLLAAAWLNMATARSTMPGIDAQLAARHAAFRAIDLVAGAENTDARHATVGLTARHLICRTTIDRLSQPVAEGEAIPHDVHEATDAVEDGLRLAGEWEQRGHAEFRALAGDLFEFGKRVYAAYQPQHLEAFVSEHGTPERSSG